MRVVAVLGYSEGRSARLDPLCALRLRHAESLASEADAVVLSGWSRHRRGTREAELMHEAWAGPDVQLVSETTARNTAENATEIAAIARRLHADEVVVVTSRWHAPRATLLVRAALRGSGATVRASSPPDRLRPRLLVREAACVAALPYHLVRRRSSGVEGG
jgi:uncharacterized SAM-binding protein YcdF (DUF218 family)